MSPRAILSISCVSQSGLLTTVTESQAAQGRNLADTTFAVLSGSAEFTAVREMPEGMAEETLAEEDSGAAQAAFAEATRELGLTRRVEKI